VLLHVPVDRPLMAKNPRVEIFAPYFRERIVIARNLAQTPQMPSLEAFKGQRIAVPGQTLAGWLLIGADGGAYREQLVTRWKDGAEAAQALMRGEVAAAAGMASELEATLGSDARFAIEPLPVPRMREGWVVGMAVKKEAKDLAEALQATTNRLVDSGEMARLFAAAGVNWRKP
jgi:ABC-type amino acid transport substrate-binding protein